MLGFTLGPNLFVALPHLATPELLQDLVHVFALQGGLWAQRRADFIRGRARSRFALGTVGCPTESMRQQMSALQGRVEADSSPPWSNRNPNPPCAAWAISSQGAGGML